CALRIWGGAVEERLFSGAELRRRKGEKFLPIGLAGKQLAVPPHVARLDRLALGGGEARQRAPREAEDRLGDPIAAGGGCGHVGRLQFIVDNKPDTNKPPPRSFRAVPALARHAPSPRLRGEGASTFATK